MPTNPLQMKFRSIFGFLFITAFLAGCTVSSHSVDSAIMLDEGDSETGFYGTGSLGTLDINVGAGFLVRKALTDKVTFGFEADYNINSAKPAWVEYPQYGRFMINQKFPLSRDLFAIKFGQGFYINNYYGDVVQNQNTGVYSLSSHERMIPSASLEFLLTPFGRREKQLFQLTVFAQGNLGFKRLYTPHYFGGGIHVDLSNKQQNHRYGLEIGIMYHSLETDYFDFALNVGLSFRFIRKKRD